MEKHPVHPTGFAIAITSGVLYVVCAAAVALFPQATIKFFNSWVHGLDLTRIAVNSISWSGFFKGLVGVLIVAYIAGALYAWVYNKCIVHCKKKRWI